MANADSVKAKIQSLIDTANHVTGNSDTNLTDAVDSLINNIGGNSELPELTNEGTAADLLLGKELIDGSGVKIVGTHECGTGVDTSDATATANDLAEGVTAYVNGEKITGTIPHATHAFWAEPSLSNSGNVYVTYPPTEQRRIVGDGVSLQSHIKTERFGDASPEDVTAGKTFTSTSGLMITGTLTAQVYYVGDTEPDDSFGNDGDLYFIRGE